MKSPSFSLKLSLLLVAVSVRLCAAAPETDDPVMKALREELARSTDKLQLENLDKPYFIAYRTEDNFSQSVTASFGSLVGSGEGLHRNLVVEVRVGSPALDSTNFGGGSAFGFSSYSMGNVATLPLDDQVTELRRQIWLATDRAYKSAVETLSKKKAALQNKTRTDTTPDFSAQAAATVSSRNPGKPFDMKAAEALVREVSGAFRQSPAVAYSLVVLTNQLERTRFVNSEGSSFVREEHLVSFIIQGTTQAADGFPLDDYYSKFTADLSGLPSKDDLVKAALRIGSNLAALREAPLVEQYNGPVLFEDQAAVEIFSQVFIPHLCAKKRAVSEGMSSSGMENPFLDKIGARVLPDFLTVVDDATLPKLGDQLLLGSASVDDEGVPTGPVRLVTKGRLKTLLVTRSPVRGVLQSTGSAHGGGSSISNLIVTSTEGGLDAAGLKAELLKTLVERGKEYAFIIRRIDSPLFRLDRQMVSSSSRDSVRVEPAVLAYKVYPDGREELVRNIEIAGMSAATFKDIIAAGREPFLQSAPFRSVYSGSGYSLSSIAVPSVIFEDITLKTPSGEIPKPQVGKHPSFQN